MKSGAYFLILTLCGNKIYEMDPIPPIKYLRALTQVTCITLKIGGCCDIIKGWHF